MTSRSPSAYEWTHQSVVEFSRGRDPVDVISEAARGLVLQGIDLGWSGPPYDPCELARLLGILVRPANLRADARTVVDSSAGELVVEYNPSRPIGRIRFSVAHELGHMLFPDVANEIRRRTTSGAVAEWTEGDDWQLEALCNVAAAEILMPSQTLRDLGVDYLAIGHLMDIRTRLAVSAEALLRRVVALASKPLTMFVAHRVDDDSKATLHVDYTVDSPAGAVIQIAEIPAGSLLWECSAVGHTVSTQEHWTARGVQVEAVAVPPYPGQRHPRIVGLVQSLSGEPEMEPTLSEVVGKVFPLPTEGKQMVLHLVSNGARRWSGAFASSLAKELPSAAKQFESWAQDQDLPLKLGDAVLLDSLTEPAVCCLVAQEGYGPSASPRIRYPQLATALEKAGEYANDLQASVHTPAIGTGQARGHWPIIREQINRSIAARGILVTIHHLESQT